MRRSEEGRRDPAASHGRLTCADFPRELLEVRSIREYAAWLVRTRLFERLPREVLDGLRETARPAIATGDRLAFDRSLDAWQARWHLTAPWVRVVALHALHYGGDLSEPPQWHVPIPTMLAWNGAERHVARLVRDLPEETRQEVIKRVQADLAEVHTASEREFWKAMARAAVDKPPAEHLDWLIRYQVLGESKNLIAQSVFSRLDDASKKAVARGIDTAAKALGLRPRPPAKGGAPRGGRRHTRR